MVIKRRVAALLVSVLPLPPLPPPLHFRLPPLRLRVLKRVHRRQAPRLRAPIAPVPPTPPPLRHPLLLCSDPLERKIAMSVSGMRKERDRLPPLLLTALHTGLPLTPTTAAVAFRPRCRLLPPAAGNEVRTPFTPLSMAQRPKKEKQEKVPEKNPKRKRITKY